MDAAQDSEKAPPNRASPPSQPRRKGRRLRSAANARSLVASTLRELEAATTIDPAQRARLLLYGSQVLVSIISAHETAKKVEEIKKLLLETKKDIEERNARERRR